MRCRRCDNPGAINMRQHKLSLCATHFPEWFLEQTQRAIKKYRMFAHAERILVAVSGGKDSLALWDVLLTLGYQADGLYIDLGIDGGFGYSARSKDKAVAFAEQHPEAQLVVVDIRQLYGENIPQVAQRRHRPQRPCSICGLIKRHEMNRIALEGGYDVLATGHNLDDEAATLFGNVLHWQADYLRRQFPVLPADGQGLARKVKPFCRFYERETAAYTLIRGIDYIEAECPYAVGATSSGSQRDAHPHGARLAGRENALLHQFSQSERDWPVCHRRDRSGAAPVFAMWAANHCPRPVQFLPVVGRKITFRKPRFTNDSRTLPQPIP